MPQKPPLNTHGLVPTLDPAPLLKGPATLDVRFWHKADMLYALTNVRFWGQKRTVTNRCLPISIYEYTA